MELNFDMELAKSLSGFDISYRFKIVAVEMMPLNAPFYAFLSFIKNNGKVVRPLRVALAHKRFVLKFRRKILFIVINLS